MILVDAGPLVALLHSTDQHHERCRRALKAITEPLASVWPAVSEAMYLLNFSEKAQQGLWEMLEMNSPTLIDLIPTDFPRMRNLMKQYRDLPMDLADAALVCVAERLRIPKIFTVDRRDFDVYRPRGFGRFSILPS